MTTSLCHKCSHSKFTTGLMSQRCPLEVFAQYDDISVPQVFTHVHHRNVITKVPTQGLCQPDVMTSLCHKCSHSMFTTETLSSSCPLEAFAQYNNISVPEVFTQHVQHRNDVTKVPTRGLCPIWWHLCATSVHTACSALEWHHPVLHSRVQLEENFEHFGFSAQESATSFPVLGCLSVSPHCGREGQIWPQLKTFGKFGTIWMQAPTTITSGAYDYVQWLPSLKLRLSL